MNTHDCERLPWAMLADYAAGDLPGEETAAVEDHLFSCPSCASRAGELDALIGTIGAAVRSAGVGGFVTDAVLNKLARDGVRVRSYVLTPGAVVPCAVWEGDEVMALRLRADLGDVTEVTLSQRIAGTEVIRATSAVSANAGGEVIYTLSAAWVRELPVVDVEVLLTARSGDEERPLGRYLLEHGGALRR